MSKPKMFHKQFYVNFTPLEWAQVLYYTWKYNKDKREIIRSMVARYVGADRRFDPDEFDAFVKKDLKEFLTEEDDNDFRQEIRTQALEYGAARRDAGEATVASREGSKRSVKQ